ncbi:hypothetical protein ACTI_28320 [Actinoplanes sp. OR16]|uniref:DUF1877 family protein n=1 Tax=Actinoplanes sp. OR16 TaxID=946334 RepID=UPI000F6BF061|nr:DUF1877 family protein [Actinoplanes sp. OR16]BBH66147.1 hypothetical protein ACTI_28320 [Actinoplanes sp. OR16]
MAVGVLLRRVTPAEVSRGIGHLEEGFEATMDDDVFEAQAADGILCSLGRDWLFVQLALTGELHDGGGPEDLVVFGGQMLGQVGPTDRDVVIVLPPDGVAAAAEYLRGVDPTASLSRHRAALAGRTGGLLPDTFLAGIKDYLESLRRFYAAAAEAGDAVAKRTYS